MSETNWMPVFVIVEAKRELHGSHLGEKGHQPTRVKAGVDSWQRIGTAFRREDGGYDVQLFAIPQNARFVMRPPRDGDRVDLTAAE